MRDHFTDGKPKFRVFRRCDEPQDYLVDDAIVLTDPDGKSYVERPPEEYFVLALKDVFAASALFAYAYMAKGAGEEDLAGNVRSLALESAKRTDRKLPD